MVRCIGAVLAEIPDLVTVHLHNRTVSNFNDDRRARSAPDRLERSNPDARLPAVHSNRMWHRPTLRYRFTRMAALTSMGSCRVVLAVGSVPASLRGASQLPPNRRST